jgi:hypothetical protein
VGFIVEVFKGSALPRDARAQPLLTQESYFVMQVSTCVTRLTRCVRQRPGFFL